jgi:hypothetical protein
MINVGLDDHSWVAECLECERRVIIDRAALHAGALFEAETVVTTGDTSAAHAWSTSPDLGIRIGDS